VAKIGDPPKAKVASMSFSLPPQQVPIVVAVTGHRDILPDDIPLLSTVVSKVLAGISADHPNTPCLLITGLAEGADRIVARCALQAGWRIGAVLPLAPDEYEADFESEQSIIEFRELLGLSVWVRATGSGAVGRPDCYRVLGDWLARQAQVLIAMWDGGPGNGPGGTADVVTRFRQGVQTDDLFLPDAGPVIHILTQRQRKDFPIVATSVGSVSYLPACPAGIQNDGEANRWSSILGRINQFNSDVVHAGVKCDPSVSGACGPLPTEVMKEGRQSAERSKADLANDLFMVADSISISAQRRRDVIFRGLMALSALAILMAQVYSSLFGYPVFLGAALALSGCGFIWYAVAAGHHLEQRYLDYRALAEACKVQYFWKVAGIPDCASDHYLREQRDELEWIRQAIQTTELGRPPVFDSSTGSRLRHLRDVWIDDQVRYFAGNGGPLSGKAAFNRLKDATWSKRGRNLFLVGMGLSFLTLVFHGFVSDPTNEVHSWILKCMIVGYSLIFAAAALTKVYQQTRAFAEHAKQYQRMGLTMQLARTRLDEALAAGDIPKAVSVIRSIGIEALAENGNWLLIHRDRPVSAQGIG
jgi:hypothetical protein